jgi:hypothetical protein
VIYVEQDDDINVTRIRIKRVNADFIVYQRNHIGIYVLEPYLPASWLLLQCFSYFSSAVSFIFFFCLCSYDQKTKEKNIYDKRGCEEQSPKE